MKVRLTPIRFTNRPSNLTIKSPRAIRGAERITIGDDVFIGENSVIRAVAVARSVRAGPDGTEVRQSFDPTITIGDRVWATSHLHLAAYRQIVIEDEVMLASNVFISDSQHGYETANVPYMYQKRSGVAPVLIKRGSWIGQNVVIMPGVTIGEFSIIGANSVVTKSIPRQCIAAGVPAKVIKKWDEGRQEWLPAGRALTGAEDAIHSVSRK